MTKKILFFVILAVLMVVVALAFDAAPAQAADGSLQPDPIFKNSKDSSKRNFILRDKDGRRIGYAINDPIFPGDNWIIYPRIDWQPVKVVSPPAIPATATDSVGE